MHIKQGFRFIFFCLSTFTSVAVETKVSSPNGAIEFKLISDDGGLKYEVTRLNQPMIERSALRISLDGEDLCTGVELGKVEASGLKEVYPWRGNHSVATNEFNARKVSVQSVRGKIGYALEVRVFNDGVAFRHIIPGDSKARVPDENSAFMLPPGSVVWYHGLGGHYEATHVRKEIADVSANEWAAPPVTFKLPRGAGYASITEAALANYPGMALQADGHKGFNLVLGHKHPISHPFELRYKADIERVSRPAAISGTIISPWRVVMISSDLNGLVNCDIVPNLCPPPDPKLFPKGINTEWIRPGRAVWKYLDGGPSTFEGMKEFCRMASQLGFEYNVLEGFWSRWSDAQLRELVDYGKEQHVGIWLWRHSKELRDAEARHAFFKRCHDLGVAGVKLDFFDHEAKEIIDFYQLLLKETAENQLMVNFHGSNKPTGESRTWPNELTREAVRGMESSKLQARALHNTTLPFTRLLAGHADYTPVHFGARRGDTTWAHQIASAAILTSPLLTYGAHPTNLLHNPAVEMIKSIPSVWDETVVLPPSEIGELAAFARRSGDIWFLAILNGPQPRKLNMALSFLHQGDYKASMVTDNKDNPASVKTGDTTVVRGGSLGIELREGGGFIARLSRK